MMRETLPPPDELRRLFADGAGVLPGTADCPAPAEIWDAAHAHGGAARRRAIVEHVAACGACAMDWATALAASEQDAGAAPRLVRSRVQRWVLPVAATLVLALAGLYGILRDERPSASTATYREAPREELRSLLPAGRPLRRGAALLRWSDAGPGARYALDVATEDLVPLVSARGLDSAEYRIAPERLAAVASGRRIVWRVEARLPDGRRIASPGFVDVIE